MRLTLAAAALVAVTGAAFAQGTTPATTQGTTTTTTPSGRAVTPGTNAMGTPPTATTTGITTPTTTAGGAQTPAATVNTTPDSTSRSPSAVQTANTMHRTGQAPVPGHNSFTMAQAARRISSAGYTQVTGLKKDSQGIWRGQAQKDGGTTGVSLDYQGNVTAQ